MYVCMHVCVYVCMYACMYVHIYIYVYIYIHLCLCVCVCMYVCIYIYIYIYVRLSRDSSVGIATRYRLDFPGIESLRGRDFLHPSRLDLGRTQQPIRGYRLFPGCKAARAWR